jgi:hypothetical protein
MHEGQTWNAVVNTFLSWKSGIVIYMIKETSPKHAKMCCTCTANVHPVHHANDRLVVFFSQNKQATSYQYISIRTNQHQPNEQTG